eukprot:scaffold21280_cov75-Phaeocystis_antarctica.AAC.1
MDRSSGAAAGVVAPRDSSIGWSGRGRVGSVSVEAAPPSTPHAASGRSPSQSTTGASNSSAWSSVKKSMKTRSAVGQTGKAPSNPIN